MFAHFVCDLLGFSVHEFPAKSETPSWIFIIDCRLYLSYIPIPLANTILSKLLLLF